MRSPLDGRPAPAHSSSRRRSRNSLASFPSRTSERTCPGKRGLARTKRSDSFFQIMKTMNSKAEYVVKNGKPTAVILPLAGYEELLEDLHDLAVIARRKD